MSPTPPDDGYTVPLHRALTQSILLGGAPRGAAIAIGTLAAAIGLGLQQFLVGLILWLVGHGLCVRLAKLDPEFVTVLVRHLRLKGHLSC
jgi:type IV secretion system protein TrbD